MEIAWDKIRPLYEAGRISKRELARQFGCSETAIRKRAKAENWDRDLSAQIVARVRSEQVRSTTRAAKAATGRVNALTEKAIIEAAAAEIIQISDRQRLIITRLEAILEELIAQMIYRPTMEEAVEALLAYGVEDPDDATVRSCFKEMLKEVPRMGRLASILKTATEVAEKIIKLQRQAYGMDAEVKSPEDLISEVIDIVSTRSKRCLPGSIDEL